MFNLVAVNKCREDEWYQYSLPRTLNQIITCTYYRDHPVKLDHPEYPVQTDLPDLTDRTVKQENEETRVTR